jgi:hypothetical protein
MELTRKEIDQLPKEEIYDLTSFVPINFSIRKRIITIYFELKTYPFRCAVCNKEFISPKLFCCKECRVSKDGEKIVQERREFFNLKKHGVKCTSQLESSKLKTKHTCEKKYGNKCYLHSEDGIVKKKKRWKSKYGKNIENPSQAKPVKDRKKKTYHKNYGKDHYFQTDEFIKKNLKNLEINREKIICKTQNTNMGKYNTKCTLNYPLFVEKKIETWQKNLGVDNPSKSLKVKDTKIKTNLKNRNCEYPTQCPLVIEKIENKNLLNYGVKWLFQLKGYISEKINKKYGYDSVGKVPEIRARITRTFLNNYFDNKIMNFQLVSPFFTKEEYQGNIHSYKWKCKKCNNEFNGGIINGCTPRCFECFPRLYGVSNLEKELQNWVEEYIQIERNKRFYEKYYKYELDIHIPSKNIGIEFNGEYYHSEISGGKDKWYHYNKSKWFLDHEIKVIHIWENEWIHKKNQVKSFLLRELNQLKIIDAYECELKELSENQKNLFVTIHSFSYVKDSYVGIFYRDDLIGLIDYFIHENEIYINNIISRNDITIKNIVNKISDFGNVNFIINFDRYSLDEYNNHDFKDFIEPGFKRIFKTDKIWDCGKIILKSRDK